MRRGATVVLPPGAFRRAVGLALELTRGRRLRRGAAAALLSRARWRGTQLTLQPPARLAAESAEDAAHCAVGAAVVPPPLSLGLGLGAAACLLSGAAASGAALAAEQSLYEILGVDRNASEQDIKKAYKRAALKNHPDKAPEAERDAYEERFKIISRAYGILSDPEKRSLYDARGEAAFNGQDASGPAGGGMGGFGPGGDPREMFSGMFGSDFFRGGRRRTPDVGYTMDVTLEDLYRGCTRELRYMQDIVCRGCSGRGATRFQRCSACQGRGATVTTQQVPGYGRVQMQQTCGACGGQGATVSPSDICQTCNGRGISQQQIEIPIKVPPNCPNRQRFSFRGKADEAPDMETGDIIVEIREKAHATFSRLGNDILLERKVPLLDALCGVRFTVMHLDGKELEVSCREGEVVRPGDLWVIKGRGICSEGDLLVRFEVEFPARLPTTAQAGELREQLRPLIDPSAPAQPGARQGAAAGIRSRLFGGGGRTEAAQATAARAPKRRREQVEALLAARAQEQRAEEDQRRHGHRRGNQNVECNQM